MVSQLTSPEDVYWDMDLEEKMALREQLRIQTDDYQRKWSQSQRLHSELNNNIMQTCDHKWFKDMKQELAPYDRRDYICERCKSRRITPGY